MSFLTTHPESFVHLHLHTQYSLLDGAIRLNDLIQKAQEFGMPAVASTDHGNMFGAIDFYKRATSVGIRPILGSEIYFTPGSRFDRQAPKKKKALDSQDEMEGRHNIHHLVLLAKNNQGYQNLCKLLSKAYLEGFYYKPRADIELLKEFSEGLIATTACLKGEVAYNIFSEQEERAVKAVKKLQEVFKDDLYLELQENGLSEQVPVNKKLIQFAQEMSVPLVATNDCHYVEQEDAKAQEVLLCVQTGKTFSDEKRMKLTSSEFYFKPAELMRQSFSYCKEACDNTLRIADQCQVDFKWEDDKGRKIYHLPDFEITTNESTEDYFRRSSAEGLEERFKGPHFTKLITEPNWESELRPQYQARLKYELDMILQMGFPGYFLIVSDFIKYAKDNNIPVGPGRGSGAGSLVAYALDITNINPLKYDLLFERFINPERISMPDFDVDFCQAGRQQVIEYVTQKYGKERVGQIITFGKLQAKAVIRDVSRVFDIPYSEADMLAKLIPDELGITLERALEVEPKLKELVEKDPKIRQIIKISRRLEGLLRHASIHAAGVIITNKPLVEYCPLFKGREGEQVVQFDKDFSEDIGLVKFDFLGLKTLTVINHATNFIQRDFEKNFDIEAIDMDDKSVYEFISQGKTIGVFQLESSGMIDLCKRIKPDNLDEVSVINALYRPGPLESGMVDDFIEIKHGRKETSYPFPELKECLEETFGVIVYQEQVMQIARVIANYSLGQADILRKAMGKKKVEVMAEHKKYFLEGADKNGFAQDKASDLFDLMAKFAAYGFNKSHAVAYGVIAYQTAFLKKYYPAPFFAALLSTELSNTDKITHYIKDAKVFGVDVLPPDINESLWLFNVIESNIRFGMGAVKNVGEAAVEEIVRERSEEGPFKGFIDFCQRVNLKAVGKRVVESLIKVGAFDSCEKMNRRTLLENREHIMNYAQKRRAEKEIGQGNLFLMGQDESEESFIDIDEVDDFEEKEKLSYEAELMGIYVSGHPLDRYSNVIDQFSSMSLSRIHDIPGEGKRQMTLVGLVSQRKDLLTKKGDRMSFLTIEDLGGKIECIVFPKTFAEYESLLQNDEPIILEGHVNLSEDPRKFFPTKIKTLKDQADEKVTSVRVNLNVSQLNDIKLERIRKIVLSYRGTVPIHFILQTPEGKARLPLGENFLVNPSPQMAAKVNEILDQDSVMFYVNEKLEQFSPSA